MRQTQSVQIKDYRRYLAAANNRDWGIVAEHVASEVRVNGRQVDRATYVNDLSRLATNHPDHRWEIVDLLHDDDQLFVRLLTTRSRHRGFELAQYRWADRRIVEVSRPGSPARWRRSHRLLRWADRSARGETIAAELVAEGR